MEAADHSWKQYLAKAIRVISIPPVMVFTLVVVLNIAREDIFLNVQEISMSVICLAIVPVLAYPLQRIIPGKKDKRREGQRKLAFLLSAAGYLTAWLFGIIAKCNSNLMMIFGTYLLSVIILIICNKGFKLRASGHACSVSGPILFLCFLLGWKAAVLCILLYWAILWASLELKRHTLRDFIMGTAACVAAFLCNLLIYIVM